MLTQKRRGRLSHRIRVQRLLYLPDSGTHERGPLAAVVDGVAIPAADRLSAWVKGQSNLSDHPHRYLLRQVMVESPHEHIRSVTTARGERRHLPSGVDTGIGSPCEGHPYWFAC